jgi:hypothetical protein
VITAFHNNDWCPGTKFSEVLFQDGAIKSIIDEAKVLANNAGYPKFVIDVYTLGELIWGMDYRSVQDELCGETV